MKELMDSINLLCCKDPLREKLLIVPSYAKGETLLKQMTEEGYNLFNLRLITPIDLAYQNTKTNLHEYDLRLINNSEARQVVFNIMEDLISNDQLTYFNHLQVSGGITKAIQNAICELKMAGISLTEEKSNQSAFVNFQKQRDLKMIYIHYQNYLHKRNWLDEGDLLEKAVAGGMLTSGSKLYLVSIDYFNDLTYLERQLLDRLPEQSLHRLGDCTEIDNESQNNDADQINIDTGKDNDQININTETVELFTAIGENVEVKQVFSKIRKSGSPFDKTVILYASSSPYSELIYKLSEKFQIPVTFGEGIMIQNTKPGKLILLLLNWIKKDYRVTDFNIFINENVLDLGEDAPSGFKIRKLLRDACIGWSRTRYLQRLETIVSKFENSSDLSERQQIRLQEYTALTGLMKEMFNILDYHTDQGDTQLISLASLASCIHTFVDRYAKVNSHLDQEAKQKICDELELISRISTSYLEMGDSIERLTDSFENIKVGQELPQAGHIHVDSYQNGWWLLRENVYLTGFDANRFPGNPQEDPILLDEERSQLTDWLSLGEAKPKENNQIVIDLLNNIKGQLVLSYSCFDTTEHKEKFPSSLILKVYRHISDDSSADYTKLQDYLLPPEGVVQDQSWEIMDEIDWWLAKYAEFGEQLQQHHVTHNYPHLHQGITAMQSRNSTEFTEYDGKVAINSQLFDPREMDKPVSPTRLELLGRCPYGYFLNRVLGIEPPEDIEYDPAKWLDPLSRGTLLHTIFEQFYREITQRQEQFQQPREDTHRDLLINMAEDHIEKQLEELPAPSELVYQYEKEELLNSSLVFLRSEEEHSGETSPMYFEIYFGGRGEENGESNMISIELPSGKQLYLSGKIDRVDVDQDGYYYAYDYKTGGTYGYSESEYYQGGRQLQHALYALALEQILKRQYPERDIQVKGSGYIFPTVKGEGARYVRYYEQQDRERVLELLDKLLDLISQGKFPMTDKSNDCNICDYHPICQRDTLKEVLKELHENHPELETFRQVRNNE